MKIPFINLKEQYQEYKQEIDSAIQKVLNSSRFIMGPEIFELEKNLSDYTGSQNVIACSSGTDALLLALMSKALSCLVMANVTANGMLVFLLIMFKSFGFGIGKFKLGI